MDGVQAAVLEVKLRYLDEWISARQANARYYNTRLMRWGTNWSDSSVRYTYHQYPLLVLGRDKLLQSLLRNGIRAGMHYPFTLPSLPCYQEYATGMNVNARLVAEHEISLPVHEMLSQRDLDAVCEVVEAHYDSI